MSARSERWSMVFDLVTMVAVLVGLTFGAVELRQLRAAQETQAVLELFRTVQTPEFARGADLILAIPEDATPDELRALLAGGEGYLIQQVRLTFEGLGVMVFRGDVELEWVDEFFRLMTILTWDRFERLTEAERERYGYPGIFEWHQWLAEQLEKRPPADVRPAHEAYADWEVP